MKMIALYLFAIVSANMSVALFGPKFAVINTFLFVGFDLISRDALHERWHNKNLKRNMILLIASGSILSGILNYNAIPIAIASFIAFLAAGIADTLTYAVLYSRAKLIKMNGSNIPASIVDSLIFVPLAFGTPILWDIIALSIVSKIAGGAMWSIIIDKFTTNHLTE